MMKLQLPHRVSLRTTGTPLRN